MSVIGKSYFPLKSSYSNIAGMKARFDALQTQLATGKKAASLSELGSDRFSDLTLRSRLTKIEGYQQTISTMNVRLSVLDKSIARLDAIEGEQRTLMTPGGYGTNNINFATSPTTSKARFDEVVDLLNSEAGGRYLMGGGITDSKPVASSTALLDGEAGRAGFRQVASERKQADAGADGMGRLGVTTAANVVSTAQDGTHPFGLKLGTLSTSSANIGVTQPAGAPPAQAVTFTGQPIAGETVTMSFTLPDGTQESLTLKAVTGTPGAGEFQIGATANDTATNFGASLSAGIKNLVATKGAAASTYAAADNFFNGQGQQVMRVAGPPYASSTALVPATASNTVMWYRGEDSANPRQTAVAKIDDGSQASYGVQANESGLVGLVKSLAAMAIETFPSGDATSKERFDAMATRQIDRLSEGHNNEPGSVEVIAVELGLAKSNANNVNERLTTYKAQAESMLGDIETVTNEEVAVEILALKTRLEASYQTTSLVSQLSLVNYLR